MPFGIGIWELLILLLVLLLVFGPKRLPEMGRQLGKGMREFKDSVSGKVDDDDEVDDVAELPPAAEQPATATPVRARARHRLLRTPTRDGPPDRPAAPEPRRGGDPRRAPHRAPAPSARLHRRDRPGFRPRLRIPREADLAADGSRPRGGRRS
ncbi:MAG: twin-arginine translocase TatA/TatE family subunit [Gaiella sp.]|nr:twin-arginine translocase TatA/TatE family subunit [Gaiella sp.]